MIIRVILTWNETEQKNHDHCSVSLIHPLWKSPRKLFTTHSTSSSPSHVSLFFLPSCGLWWLSRSDNQNWEDAVSGWAEVNWEKELLFTMVFLQPVVLWLHLSSSDMFSYTSHVLMIRSVLPVVNCTLMLRWLITAIFGVTNLLDPSYKHVAFCNTSLLSV